MIRVACPHCQTKYRFDEAQLGGKSRVKAKCKKCGGKIDIEVAQSSSNETVIRTPGPPSPPKPDAPSAAPVDESPAPPPVSNEPAEPEPAAPEPADPGRLTASEEAFEGGQLSTARVKKLRSDEPGVDQTITGTAMDAEIQLPPDKKYSLAVLQGKASGQIFEIQKVRTLLGRADSDVILDDPEASRQHAAIEIYGARVVVADLKSTNGTFVDGEEIEKTELQNHSEFRIGEHVFMLIVTDRE